MNTCDFWINLGVSVLGSSIPLVGISIWGYLKWWIPFNELKKSGIQKVHANQEKAEPFILKAIRSSHSICVLAVKGGTFSDKSKVLGNVLMGNANITQCYLISDTKEKNPYIEKREIELTKNKNKLSIALENSYNLFKDAAEDNKSIEVRRHCEIVRFRIIILDNCLFLSFQEKEKEGKDCQMLQISKNSPIYQTYKTYFDDLWEKYK
jgi:hypothetical protein